MEFPNKPWFIVLDVPTPAWATHQVDFIGDGGESYSVWISHNQYQYFRTTSDEDGLVMDVPDDSGDWDVNEWGKRIERYSYSKITDLQPIEENE